jgi:uncharacterized protein (DUF433 family)
MSSGGALATFAFRYDLWKPRRTARRTLSLEANMEREKIITVDPEIMSGTPVFAGTRVPVESLIDHLKAGDTLEDFLEGFPTVRREQAQAFLELALNAAVGEHARAA